MKDGDYSHVHRLLHPWEMADLYWRQQMLLCGIYQIESSAATGWRLAPVWWS